MVSSVLDLVQNAQSYTQKFKPTTQILPKPTKKLSLNFFAYLKSN